VTPRTAATALAAALVVGPAAVARDALSFADLAGTYVSSSDGGCLLELRKDSSYTLSCGSRAMGKGKAVPIDADFGIEGIQGAFGIGPSRRSPTVIPIVPPAPGDPTRGPYVVRDPDDDASPSFLLRPLHWGDRLYLVHVGNSESFCESIRAGREPRTKPNGEAFLRRGDHRKVVGSKLPKDCERSK
jgi:hypothetical protein